MKNEIKTLSIEEKIALAEELWESIENERKGHLSDEQKELLDKRLERHDSNPDAARPWTEIRKKYFK
jgi:putative addiction module component (TIGR02574 family)